MLLPYADALCVGLRRRAGAVPACGPPVRTSRHALVSALGSANGTPRDALRRELERGRANGSGRRSGAKADVIHPPVRTEFFTPGGEREGFFLYVGRFVGYKRPDLVVDAFADLPEQRLVMVGEGPLLPALAGRATPNVSFLGTLDDTALRDLYRSARALVYPANEDFGIAMAEAQACGTPVVGLAAGGAIDIVEPGRTGWLVHEQSVDELRAVIRRAAVEELDGDAIARSAERFSAARFRREMQEAAAACAEAA